MFIIWKIGPENIGPLDQFCLKKWSYSLKFWSPFQLQYELGSDGQEMLTIYWLVVDIPCDFFRITLFLLSVYLSLRRPYYASLLHPYCAFLRRPYCATHRCPFCASLRCLSCASLHSPYYASLCRPYCTSLRFPYRASLLPPYCVSFSRKWHFHCFPRIIATQLIP